MIADPTTASQYLFCLVNMLQGFYIFYHYCIGDVDVRRVYKSYFNRNDSAWNSLAHNSNNNNNNDIRKEFNFGPKAVSTSLSNDAVNTNSGSHNRTQSLQNQSLHYTLHQPRQLVQLKHNNNNNNNNSSRNKSNNNRSSSGFGTQSVQSSSVDFNSNSNSNSSSSNNNNYYRGRHGRTARHAGAIGEDSEDSGCAALSSINRDSSVKYHRRTTEHSIASDAGANNRYVAAARSSSAIETIKTKPSSEDFIYVSVLSTTASRDILHKAVRDSSSTLLEDVVGSPCDVVDHVYEDADQNIVGEAHNNREICVRKTLRGRMSIEIDLSELQG